MEQPKSSFVAHSTIEASVVNIEGEKVTEDFELGLTVVGFALLGLKDGFALLGLKVGWKLLGKFVGRYVGLLLEALVGIKVGIFKLGKNVGCKGKEVGVSDDDTYEVHPRTPEP